MPLLITYLPLLILFSPTNSKSKSNQWGSAS